MKLFAVVLFYCSLLGAVYGHGRLTNPPQRSSAWRYGYNVSINYNDNQLNCGGQRRQWEDNDGKCGTCGDPFDAGRPNEAGGKYATGTITGSYAEGGIINAEVELTANHKGWFEFRLCVNNNPSRPVTQACLNQTLLTIIGNGSRFYLQTNNAGTFKLQLQLPAELTCSQCVLQWRYNTGNSWGCEGDNHCCVGCGKQETFVNCADIEIISTSSTNTPVTLSHKAPTSPPPSGTNTGAHSSSSAVTLTTVSNSSSSTSSTTSSSGDGNPNGGSGSDCKGKSDITCVGVEPYTSVSGIEAWCKLNCSQGYCPSSHCSCNC